MPYTIRKIPNKKLYRVFNSKTKQVYSRGSTLENAKKQVRLLYLIENRNRKNKTRKYRKKH